MKHYSIVVIGAGAGGLVVAIGAVKAGKKVLLIEQGNYGGDCTNFGCIPSKSLIASAHMAHALKAGNDFGVKYECPKFNADEAMTRVRNIIKKIRDHEEPPALKALGVDTITGVASFETPKTLKVVEKDGGEQMISADTIVIATGSHPFTPPIEGLKDSPYLTNETIFDLEKIPEHLGVLGAGPIGSELAQAFHRLGSKVTVITSKRGVMPNDDQEVHDLMEQRFKEEGITIHIGCETNSIVYKDNAFNICISVDGQPQNFTVDNFLVATGRRANLSKLQLDKAAIKHSDRGIIVDDYGRTNHHHIFAIGDVQGGPFFTHLAENHGRTVLTTLLLPGPLKKKLDKKQAIPHVTFTDPEVAGFGLTEKQAKEKYGERKVAVYMAPLAEVDRAITAGRTEGFLKVITKKWSSKILGATIVAPRAGEMLPELSLAMLAKIPLRKLARLIHPYPIYGAAVRKAADMWLTQTVLGSLKGKGKGKKHG